MIEVIRRIMDSDIMVIIAFAGTVFSAVKITLSFVKKATKIAKKNDNRRIVRDILISIFLIFIGLVCPGYLIFESISKGWVEWFLVVTQILSWYVVVCFIGLAYFVIITLWRFRKVKIPKKDNDDIQNAILN